MTDGSDEQRDDATKVFWDDFDPEESVEEEAYLIVISGSRVGEMIRIPEQLTIGRDQDADFRITNDFMSRLHLKLERNADDQIMATDLESSNGTFVNDSKIEQVALKDGDKIRLGSTTILKFSYVDDLDQSFQKHMYEGAIRDALTGLYNRRHMTEYLETEFAYHTRHNSPLSLVILDIDHFKHLNDTYGHVVGDSVLAGLAEQLETVTRSEDLVARFGGEEFVIAARGIPCELALKIADRIRRVIEDVSLVPSSPEVKITISAGVAGLPNREFTNPKELIDAADKALYQAKREGRNRVHLFSSGS